MSKDIKKLKEFKRWFGNFVKKDYGSKCKDFTWDCPTCHANFVREFFDDFVDDIIGMEKWEKNKRKDSIKRKGTAGN